MKNLKNEIQSQEISKKIINLIDNSERILITSHENPDGDSIGSQLALGGFLRDQKKTFWILNHGNVPDKYKFIDPNGFIQTEEIDVGINPDLVIVVECPNLNRVGWVKRFIGDHTPIINIDHHQDNQNFGTLNFIDTSRAAVAEMIFDLISFNGYIPDRNCANALFLAIYTDTGRFRHDSTTPECLRKSARLLELGADPKAIADHAYYNYPAPALKLLGMVLSKLELRLNGRVCYLTVTADDIKATGANIADIEGIIDYGLFVEGVKVSLLFKQLADDEIRVGFRCREGFDILPIARQFGGGGHHHAAGCSAPGTLECVKISMLEILRRMLDGSQ